MASWTDILPTFKPYVQQLPVEAMVQVGMQKQAQYNAGIQKIQGEIDKIAGLDIYRDVDKNYLQSKLNELGDKMTFFAAGDFSDFQLTNSVAGMTNQIIKDKNVQNAVGSTARLRKEIQAMEKARSEGKSSEANIFDLNQKINRYATSTNLDDSFVDRYVPYTDVKKKAMEAIKALHPNLQSVDIPFVINPDGSVDTSKVADAMVRNKVEGISENQIKQAIYATLTPDDINQLSIDGKYQFRDVTPQQLGERARLSFENSLQDAVDSLALLDSMKRTNTDPSKAKFIDDQISYYKELVGDDKTPGTLRQTYEENIKNINLNPDGVKTQIYKDGFVSELGNAFKWQNQEKQFLTNPLRSQLNWVADMKQKQYEFAENKKIQLANLEIARAAEMRQQRKDDYDRLKDANEAAQKQADELAKRFGLNLPGVPGSVSTMNEDNAFDVFTNTLSTIESDINGSKNQVKRLGFTENDINMMLNKLSQGKVSEIDERALPLIQSIAKDKDFLNDLNNLSKNIESKVGQKIDPAVRETSETLRNLSEGPFGLLAGRIASPIYDFFTNKGVNKEYNRLLAENLSKVFLPVTKPIGIGENGELTPAALNNIITINETQKKAKGTTIPEETFSNKNIKNTKAYIRQEGRDYKLVVKNSDVNGGDESAIPISQNDAIKYFGPSAVNNTWNLSTRLAISPNLSSSIKSDPDNAMFKHSYYDFPNMKKISINSNLLEDPNNPGTFIYETYPLLKDGTRTKLRLTGKNRAARLGYEQALKLNNDLNDSEYMNMIMEQYPNFNIFSLEGVDKK